MVAGCMPRVLFLILRLVVLSTFLIGVVGCASLGPKETAFGTKIESPPLYMDIAKREDGRYYVTGFSSKSGLVKLNDLSTTLNTRGERCGFGEFWGLDRGKHLSKSELCTPNDSKFRKRAVDIGGTALMYVATLGFAAVFGGYATYGYFDDEAYRHAVTDALKNSNIDREAILRIYKDLVAEQNKLEELRLKYESAYLADLREKVLSPRIIDKSQFYRNDADLRHLVKISPNEIKPYHQMPEDGLSTLAPTNISFVGPEELKKAIMKLKEYIPRYEEYLRNATSIYKVIGPEEISEDGYHMLIKAPKTVPRDGTRTVTYDVVILGKDFKDLYPALSASDGNISLQFRHDSLMLMNNTASYANIFAISVYYNKDVYTKEQSIALPPQTSLSRPINIKDLVSDEILEASRYEKLTADIARKRTIDFGFAIKYQMTGQVTNKTLYHVKKFNLYDVIVAKK